MIVFTIMTTEPAPKSTGRSIPPYLPASTFMTVIDSWRAVRPSRVERSVLNKVAGSLRTWLIAALKYFQLIDEEGVPTPKLDALATASEQDRPRLIAEMLREGYPFLFTKGVDLSNITYNDLRRKFEETGAQGETAVKAISFFTGLAKMANISISPYVATRQRRGGNGRKATTKKTAPNTPPPPTPPTPPPFTPPGQSSPTTPMQVLIEMLNVQDMDEGEQAAVWTLIRYLKKGR
jgi:hypothetical protein